MTNTLREFITETDKKACEVFAITGEIEPVWHAITEYGEHKIMPGPSVDKDTAALLMRAYFAIYKVVRYVFINEAWTMWLPTDRLDEIPEIAEHGLADHPERIEVLMYQAEDETGLLTAHRNIIRPGHGKRPTLGPLEFVNAAQSEGRFVGMLPQRGTVQ